MELLGARIRHRRRQLKLKQSDVSGSNSASFLSKVENGSADPSLNSLRDWSEKLGVPAAELLGDHLLLEAAKHSILHPEICNRYLDKLKATPATCFLKKLSASAAALSIAVPEPPADPELQFLTAQVLRRRGMLQEAGELAERAIAYTYSPLLRISYLSLLCQIYGELDEAAKQGGQRKTEPGSSGSRPQHLAAEPARSRGHQHRRPGPSNPQCLDSNHKSPIDHKKPPRKPGWFVLYSVLERYLDGCLDQ